MKSTSAVIFTSIGLLLFQKSNATANACKSLEKIVSCLAYTEKFNDLTILYHNELNNNDAIHLIDRILENALQTSAIRLKGLNFHNNIPITPNKVTSTSCTLIIYIHAAHRAPNHEMIRNALDLINRLSHERHKPKILLMMILNEDNNDFAWILHYSWTRKMLDTTILEIQNGKELKNVGRTFFVHQYNPFTEQYTRILYNPKVKFFPDKTENLNGYTLRVDLLQRSARSHVRRNSSGHIVEIGSYDGMTLETLSRKMNFTPKFVAQKSSILDTNVRNGTLRGPLADLLTGRTELMATTLPILLTKYYELVDVTKPSNTEEWCIVVPILIHTGTLKNWAFVHVLCVTFAVVLLFWMCKTVLKFDRKTWHPLRIVGFILGVPMLGRSNSTAERVLLMCCVAVSARYSSMLYSELMGISLPTTSELSFDSFEDVEAAGLTPEIHMTMYSTIDYYSDKKLAKLKKKGIPTYNISGCPDRMLVNRNISCVMEESMAREAISTTMHRGKPVLKITRICYWHYPVGYVLSKGSPYIERVSDILYRVHESGLGNKWLNDYLGSLTARGNGGKGSKMRNENPRFVLPLVLITTVGYVLSFVTLLVEITMHKLRKIKM
ncbi:hypothetical protein KM043_000696 [Ampulex compressa]|nr:hypothetical protein KM043_000696 [Ampulex compressa]